jgi:molybdate transport system ATP-binding protein
VSLDAEVRVRLDGFSLDAALSVGAGELVAVLGPNGAGKTTLLRALAGLLPISSGRIELDGRLLEDPARRVRVPAERRPVGVVFQDYLLFPHLSALENVAFGLRARGAGRRTARERALEWLRRVGLGDKAASRPAQLSGGQAQRVALARALATDPRLLLLDEPLAALDVSTRAELRRDLRRHLASFDGVRVLITHDPLEAAALADRLVVIEAGRVVQSGSVREVSERPRSRYVADLVGVNLFRGRASAGLIELERGGRLSVPAADGDVFAVVHPRSVALYSRRPEGTPRNVWEGRAASLDLEEGRVRVSLEGVPSLVAEVTPAAVAELGLSEGRQVWVAVKATEIQVYPA